MEINKNSRYCMGVIHFSIDMLQPVVSGVRHKGVILSLRESFGYACTARGIAGSDE
jgi:hypothetical protein